ncbi:uncharacterized protein MAM_02199 [Metarhizium album ARSEF 1941]|uniref:37S ribosomal protein rsm22 n=1 Tax=Metarhizium album (strain ARSEF 1941) TaxID=1081103 RepID=A0A0B2X4S3_METAS|nr:uncharacterized protein MAM_02199 [Metarhizium album ARSEF 1941]KHO00276.1 hypothetical protein MAM_02199 [Metarhizium album ARSEF 1941]
MTLEVWPHLSPEELHIKAAESLERELEWTVQETITLCHELKHGIEDCYALLAPIDPGSTLVMSTHRNEKVKGTITRVGTRLVKGTLSLQLRTLPAQQLAISPLEPIHVPPLDAIFTNLTQSIDLLGLLLGSTPAPTADNVASALAALAECLAESAGLLKGPASSEPDPAWQTASCPAHHFSPAMPPSLSFYVTLQESSIVLWLRALEPAGAPVNFGVKLGLAIGTVRRLEHDEMDTVFRYCPDGDGSCEPKRGPGAARTSGKRDRTENVFVREKVRIESADPSLISLYSKLGFLSHMLGQARHNLAAVMGVELDA